MSDAMRSVARIAGLAVVPYESDLGFTVFREDDDLYFFFVLIRVNGRFTELPMPQ